MCVHSRLRLYVGSEHPNAPSLGNVLTPQGQAGATSIDYDAASNPLPGSADLARRKRKLGQTELEVPDSEDDEDYGWADEDEAAMPAPPPQWQGSEDVLLGQEIGRSDDGSGEEEDERESHDNTASSEAGDTG